MTTFVVDFFFGKKMVFNVLVFLVFNLLAPGSTSVAELEKSGRKAAVPGTENPAAAGRCSPDVATAEATGSKGNKTKVTGDAESGVCVFFGREMPAKAVDRK